MAHPTTTPGSAQAEIAQHCFSNPIASGSKTTVRLCTKDGVMAAANALDTPSTTNTRVNVN